MTRRWWTAALGFGLLVGCNADGNREILADQARDEQVVTAANALFQSRFDAFAVATEALRNAAPAPDLDGWNAKDDAVAVASMRTAWLEARAAYTSVEVLASTLSPELHRRLDTDYDDLIAGSADTFAFDEHGVAGLQAVERILWSDVIPAHVIDHEAPLEHYFAADFPRTEHEAEELKNELLAHLSTDARTLRDGFRAAPIDASTAYSTTTRSLQEQLGQLEEAGKGEGKARYAGVSLANLRTDLAATEATYAVFRSWILAKSTGAHTDEEVAKAFTRLHAALARSPGDELPLPPAGWPASDPSGEMLATPFGILFAATRDEADASVDGSLCFEMVEAAGLVGVTANQ